MKTRYLRILRSIPVVLSVILCIGIIRSCNNSKQTLGESVTTKLSVDFGEQTSKTINSMELQGNIYKYKKQPQESAGIYGVFAQFEIEHDLPKRENPNSRCISIDKARSLGAKGKLSFYVVDLENHPISHVSVYATCRKSQRESDIEEYHAETDDRGIASLEVQSTMDVKIILSKEGYYNSQYQYSFYKHPYQCIDHGRWLPWNPTLEMNLKPIRNPTKRIIRKVNLQIPSRGEPYGFDCVEGDFIAPHGTGKNADFSITFISDATVEGMKQYRYTNEVVFSSTSKGCGFKILPYDHYSQHPFVYEAPTEGYETSLGFSYQIWGPGAIYIHETDPFRGGNYIVFRSQVDEKETPSMRYGKILPFQFTYAYNKKENIDIVSFMYYVNSISNDRNLEGEDEIDPSLWFF